MKVLGFRFCTVSPEATNLAAFFDAVGFERHPLEAGDAEGPSKGAVFAAGESWLAMWPPSAEMPAGIMLQVVVDDADAFANRAREQGLNVLGPTDSKTKRIYFLQAPTGLRLSIQSRLPGQVQSIPAPAVPEKAKSLPLPPAPRGRTKKLPVPPPPPGGPRRILR
jgi:hypothetical protein